MMCVCVCVCEFVRNNIQQVSRERSPDNDDQANTQKEKTIPCCVVANKRIINIIYIFFVYDIYDL
jgi:hypothetical protein